MTEYKTDLHLYSFPPSGPVCLHTPASFSRLPSSFSFSHFPYHHLLHYWHSLAMRLNSILLGSTGKPQLRTALFCKAETSTGLSLLSNRSTQDSVSRWTFYCGIPASHSWIIGSHTIGVVEALCPQVWWLGNPAKPRPAQGTFSSEGGTRPASQPQGAGAHPARRSRTF